MCVCVFVCVQVPCGDMWLEEEAAGAGAGAGDEAEAEGEGEAGGEDDQTGPWDPDQPSLVCCH